MSSARPVLITVVLHDLLKYFNDFNRCRRIYEAFRIVAGNECVAPIEGASKCHEVLFSLIALFKETLINIIQLT